MAIGLVEGLDLENVLVRVSSSLILPVCLPGHRPSPDDGVMSLGLSQLSLDEESCLLAV